MVCTTWHPFILPSGNNNQITADSTQKFFRKSDVIQVFFNTNQPQTHVIVECHNIALLIYLFVRSSRWLNEWELNLKAVLGPYDSTRQKWTAHCHLMLMTTREKFSMLVPKSTPNLPTGKLILTKSMLQFSDKGNKKGMK